MISRHSPHRLYQQVATDLAGRIKRQELDPPGVVPSEQRICEEFDVSRGTARKATALLRDLGLIFTVRQRGSYVVGSPSEADTGPERGGGASLSALESDGGDAEAESGESTA
jgi:DNA-binding GntR family transcriptional regulator